MSSHTIDTAMAKRMAEAAAIRGASVIGQPGGWSVLLKLGVQERPLGTQRSGKPRVWRSLDLCVKYLRDELHIPRLDLLDATHHSDAAPAGKKREDAAERLRRAHAGLAYDQWFREQVEAAVVEADSPAAEWVPHEEASAGWAKKRAKLVKQAKRAAEGAA